MKNFFATLGTRIRNAAASTRTFVVKHKVISAIIVLALIGGGYWAYSAMAANDTSTEYVLSKVTSGPLVVTVTGSGTVDAKDTLNVTPQGSASGQITQLDVTPGQTVKAGQIIAELDMTNAAEAVTSARQDLESAEISYKQTQSSSGTSVSSDQTSITTAEVSAGTALATNYTDLPVVMNGLDGILHDLSTISEYNAEQNIDAYSNLINTAQAQTDERLVETDDTAAVTDYQNAKAEYANTTVSDLTPAQIQQLDTDTLSADLQIETTLKDTLTYYEYINDQLESAKNTRPTQLSTQIASLTTYQSTVTSDAANVNNTSTSLTNAVQTLAQDTQSSGISSQPLTVQSAELNVQKAQETLDEALTTESDYIVRAPFDGVIGTVPVNEYDQASSGTTIATLITTDEYADLSLNEADAAKIVVGQPATITFDALPNVTMPGSVAIIDPVGTVSEGVTTYDVKLSFSEQNSQIKPGMTAEAVITTASSSNAIQVPSAAVTTTGTMSFIKVATITNASSTLAKMQGAGAGSGTASSTTRRTRTATSTGAYAGGSFGGGTSTTTGAASAGAAYAGRSGGASASLTLPASEVTIKTIPVTTGLSNDTMTQITSGLSPGEYVVTATQSAAATKKSTATSATSLLGGSTTRTGLGGATGGGGYTGARTGGTGGGAAAGGGAGAR